MGYFEATWRVAIEVRYKDIDISSRKKGKRRGKRERERKWERNNKRRKILICSGLLLFRQCFFFPDASRRRSDNICLTVSSFKRAASSSKLSNIDFSFSFLFFMSLHISQHR